MSVLVCGLATMKIDPPWPPSPPLGPPRGTNFSRRNARQPRPPWPAATWMSTSSTNITIGELANWRAGESRDGSIRRLSDCAIHQLYGLLDWLDADDAAVRAVVLELHAAGDLREDRVVFAEAGVQPRAESPPALTHDDGAAGDEIAVVRLHTQPLRVGVAAVARAALTFLMSHT